MTTAWYPARLLDSKPPTTPYALLILNQPINKNALDAIINGAAMVVCADAGADRYMDYEQGNPQAQVPDAVVGDLDSVSPEALEHYKARGVTIAKVPDQYATDFTKGLQWMRQEWDQRKGKHEDLDIIAVGGLGGRVDQGFSQIHHLYMVLQRTDLLHGAIYLLSEQSLSFVLAEGWNEIHVNDTVFTENVGIIPVLGLSHISTSGLEWDVEDWPTEFGGQVSTSNHVKSDLVKVRVHDKRPLFTVELSKSLQSAGL